MKRGRSKEQLRKLRKKYRLGEYRTLKRGKKGVNIVAGSRGRVKKRKRFKTFDEAMKYAERKKKTFFVPQWW